MEAFQNLCEALRSNDPTVTDIDTRELPNGCGRPLGEALQRNTIVSKLTLQNPNLDVQLTTEENATAVQHPLLGWIGTSNTLKTVEMRGLEPTNRHMYEAIAVNTTVIELFAVACSTFDPLAILLRTTRSVRKLSLSFSGSPPVESTDEWSLQSAFAANESLEHVRIFNPDEVNITSLLRGIASHRALKELHLRIPQQSRMDHCNELANLLQLTPTLDSLVFVLSTVDGDAMNLLLTALSSSQTLARLGLTACSLDDDALAAFVSYMQSTANTGTNRLHTIHLMHRLRFLIAPNRLYADAAATLLVGSSLEEFAFKGGDHGAVDTMAFLRTLLANVSNIRLRRLGFERLNAAEFTVLAEFLRQTHRLEGLYVSQLSREIEPASLLSALEQNGSLATVKVTGGVELNDTQQRRLLAYAQRNREMPKMLSKPAIILTTCSGSQPDVSIETVSAVDTAREAQIVAALTFFPRLFDTALQSPRTSPNAMLSGLLSAFDRTGHVRSDKRAPKSF